MSRRWILTALLAAGCLVAAQTPARVTQSVDDSQIVRLPGNRPAQLVGAADQGPVAANVALNRMLLLLRRSPAQELALRDFIDQTRENGSPNFHHWLTPADFGARFGPAPSDIAAVTAWLTRSGFTVNRVAAGGGVIEFSGTAGAVAAALHAPIHHYLVDGIAHLANATDPAIPAALAPVVDGIVSLHDFRKPALGARILGQVALPQAAGPAIMLTSNNGIVHALVPGDFSTIYNLKPLYSQQIAGKGETIAVVARSQITMSDAADFRGLFEHGTGSLNVVVDGADPGIVLHGDDVEATLDAEWSGGVAPDANIDLVVSASTDTSDGVDLSALYIVDHDLASVMTTSFGQCESQMGSAENAFWNALYEQAAAEGITAFVSAGDNGPAGCDDPNLPAASQGLAVSGLASTPFNTAVGGTEFNEGANSALYWSPTNLSDLSSALSYIPEQAWNESGANSIYSGSGGASGIYAKPAWQTGIGVPADGARDLPDISFTAAGHDGYVICFQRLCENNQAVVIGGTSASSPAMAGLMALVDQKMAAPQGTANGVLYKLATSQNLGVCNANGSPASNCVFLDTTTGGNTVTCEVGSPNCINESLGYNATTGYDLATGLGSVNAANLVNQWGTVSFAPSNTTLALTAPANWTHGQSVPVAIQVSGSAAVPSGQVEIIAQSPANFSSVQTYTLDATGKVTASTANLPAGNYTVVARYGGDLNYGASTSAPVNVTVAKENAAITLSAVEFDDQGNETTVTAPGYGDRVYFKAVVTGISGFGPATGTVALSDSNHILSASEPLNATGSLLTFQPYVPLILGAVTIQASYAGDANFNPVAPVSLVLNVGKTPTVSVLTSQAGNGLETYTLTITTHSTQPFNAGDALQVFAAGQPLTTEVLRTTYDLKTGYYGANAIFNLYNLPGASATVYAQFPGDVDSLPSTSNTVTAPTSANLSFNPAQLAFGTVAVGASATLTTVATNTGGLPMPVVLFASLPFSASNNCGGTVPASGTCGISVVAAPHVSGFYANEVELATYELPVTMTAPGFTAGVSIGSQTITSGQTAHFSVVFTPTGGFTGPLTVACSNPPPFASCSFSPASQVFDGKTPIIEDMAVATVAHSAAATRVPSLPLGLMTALACLSLVGLLLISPRLRLPVARFTLATSVALLIACGGAASGGGGGGGGGTGSGALPGPVIQVNPTSLNFGTVSIGQTSAAQTVTVTNLGNTAFAISQVSAQGPYRTSSTCAAAPLNSLASCSIAVTFAPTATGSSSGILSIANSQASLQRQVALSGSGDYTYTSPGSYDVTVTGTSGPVNAATSVRVTVQ